MLKKQRLDSFDKITGNDYIFHEWYLFIKGNDYTKDGYTTWQLKRYFIN